MAWCEHRAPTWSGHRLKHLTCFFSRLPSLGFDEVGEDWPEVVVLEQGLELEREVISKPKLEGGLVGVFLGVGEVVGRE